MLVEGSINLLKGKAFTDLSKLIFNKKSLMGAGKIFRNQQNQAS